MKRNETKLKQHSLMHNTSERDRDRDRDRRERDREKDRYRESDRERERERDRRDADRDRSRSARERESDDRRSRDHKYSRDPTDARDTRTERHSSSLSTTPRNSTTTTSATPTNTATPASASNNTTINTSTQVRPELNFFSEKFDPLQALYQLTELPPSLPKVRPLGAFHKCRHLLPPSDPDYIAPPSKKKQEAEQKAKLEGLSESERRIKEIDEQRAIIVSAQMQRKKEKIKIELNKSVLEEITAKLDVGPLSMLKKCMEEKCRIRVVIRRVREIRGYCVGQLQAFDKHFNLILRNVFEEYSVWEYETHSNDINNNNNNNDKRSNQNNTNNNSNNTNENSNRNKDNTAMQQDTRTPTAPERRLVKRTRRRKQLLIKGDTIVLVHRWLET